ncbi:MAG: tetratricopeptide repeat protein, partial [Bacteroidetes bacterium]|nr:tetratricopeptide repeat protein [Bacteroidota bacterium]
MLLISGKYRILQQLGKQSLKRVGSLLCKPCIISLPVFIFLFSLKSYGSAGQNPIVDSLQNRLLSETDDSVRLILMLELGYQDERISLDTSLKVYCEGLEYARKISRPDFEARFLNSLGIVYRSQSDFPKAIEYFQSSLSVYEKISQSPVATMTLAGKKGMAICLLNIGNVHNNQKSYDKALEYYRKAVVINENIVEDGLGDPEVRRRLASCYNNIGIALKNLRRLEESLENYKKVIPIYEELRFAGGLASCYGNIAILCNEMGDYDCSVEYNLKALGIFERSGDKLRATIILGNLASMEESRKNYNFAVAYAEKSLKLAEETGAVLSQKYACEHLSKAWEGLGNIAKAFEYHKRYFILNDSIFNEEKNRQVEEMEAKYQNEKKQQEIEKQQLLLEKKEVEIKQKEAEAKQERTQKIAFVAGFIFMLVLALLIFLSYRQKKKANRILAVQKQQIAEKNEELLQLNEEIVAQRDQIEIQKNLVTEQRDRIEFIHEELTDSIQYAKYIQEALLPKREMLDCMFGDYFILFQPKDIVSGDFYWATTVFVPGSRDARPYVSTAGTKILVVAVADCTGHGVPGAFMSMLGISLLNEIVRKREVTTASQVLDILRERVISSLQQNNIRGE